MERIFVGIIVTVFLIMGRFVFISDPVLGAALTYLIAISFLVWGGRYAFNNANTGVVQDPASDPDSPDQGFDPRTVEVAKRRADRIE